MPRNRREKLPENVYNKSHTRNNGKCQETGQNFLGMAKKLK